MNNGVKRGENHYCSRLTEEQVIYILTCDKTVKELCQEFGVKHSTISQIRNRQTWRHVVIPGDEI